MPTPEKVRIRAKIEFGSVIVETPNIISFSVRKARGQPSATLSTSLKVLNEDLSSATLTTGAGGTLITVQAGTRNDMKLIFTGYILKFTLQPSWTDSRFVILNLAGKDKLFVMENQNVTRRTKSETMGRWGYIDQVLRKNSSFEQRFSTNMYNKQQMQLADLLAGKITGAPPVKDLDGNEALKKSKGNKAVPLTIIKKPGD